MQQHLKNKHFFQEKPSLFVFTALSCEAKPLIKAWKLKHDTRRHPFSIYRNEERLVTISGIGQTAIACAIGYVLSLYKDVRLPLLLNLGIAGHGHHSLGSLFLAHKIINRTTGKRFYPQLPFSVICKTAVVTTEVRIQTDYSEDCLFDMEAAAFYEAATKFSSNELIQTLKIISDNTQSPPEAINCEKVEHWVQQQLEAIETIIIQLESCRNSLPAPIHFNLYEQLAENFYLTVNTAEKLNDLLQRWSLLHPNIELPWRTADIKNGKQLIAWLEGELTKCNFDL